LLSITVLADMARKSCSQQETVSDVSLGRRIALLRKERGFAQFELAEKLGVVQSIVSDHERGRLRPHPDMLVRLAQTLQVSADEILRIKTKKKQTTRIPTADSLED